MSSRAWLGVLVLAVSVVGVGPAAQTPEALPTLRGDAPTPRLTCGTSAQWELAGRPRTEALAGGLADGEPFTFDQDPPLVFADYAGSITLHNFSVVGDFATVQFLRENRDSPSGRPETWQRATSRSVNGQLISVFEPSWDATELAKTLGSRRIGFDQPYVYWGAYQVPGGTTERYVFIRAGLYGIPTSAVVQLNDRVQYSSNVVNLVVPTFDDARVAAGMNGFDIGSASRLFYQYFSDTYDVLAFTPEPTALGSFGAFHLNVRNAVSGLNLALFDQSRQFGSNGVLQGAEVYTGSAIARYEDTDHEMAHQWGSNFDWGRVAGITRAGHQPSAHAPLWTGGETLIGAVLWGDRRVAASSSGYVIERTPAPARYHPIELYSMGTLSAKQVPDFSVFASQDQFSADTSASPSVGTGVQGDLRAVSIADVIQQHGERQGPSPTTWRRATVLVSRNRLASQQEMSYWNFFAQRLADRNQASRPAFNNFVSFRRATQNAVTLSTAVRPLTQPALSENLDTDTPSIGSADFRGVAFSSPVPSRFVVGQPVTLTGHVTATDPVDFNQIDLGFWKVGSDTSVDFSGTISRSGDFTVTIRFTDSQKAAYEMSVYLFWSGSGGQYPRSSVSTISVE